MSNNIKKNVKKFEEDVRGGGGYEYTGDRLSSSLANARISAAIATSYDFKGKNVLDIGCGDGSYTFDFPSLGAQMTYGIDPASAAVEHAQKRSKELKLHDLVDFRVGNVYDLSDVCTSKGIDCIVFRGVLHHLPDPERAIVGLKDFQGSIIVLEPNGYNPVLKVIERISEYHIEHEERSFTTSVLSGWLKDAGFSDQRVRYCNLVPMFCPDWLAKACKAIEPVVEKIPIIRNVCCGQVLITASK